MLDGVRFFNAAHVGFQQGRRDWLNLQCPKCGSEGTHGGWYLGFNVNSGSFYCWRCGKLKFWDILSALTNIRDHDKLHELVQKHQTNKGAKLQKEKVTRHPKIDPPAGSGPMLKQHKEYLKSRKFDPDKLEKEWGLLGTNHLAGDWSWRVVIPIHDRQGKLVAYQGRSIGDANPKYRMTEDEECLQDPDSMIYGIDKVPGNSVLVVEGCPGVFRLGPGAVGTFGIAWRLAQANELRKFTKRFILYDPEPAAQIRAEKLAQHLSLFPGETEIVSGFETDPGDFTDKLAHKIRKRLGFPEMI